MWSITTLFLIYSKSFTWQFVLLSFVLFVFMILFTSYLVLSIPSPIWKTSQFLTIVINTYHFQCKKLYLRHSWAFNSVNGEKGLMYLNSWFQNIFSYQHFYQKCLVQAPKNQAFGRRVSVLAFWKFCEKKNVKKIFKTPCPDSIFFGDIFL